MSGRLTLRLTLVWLRLGCLACLRCIGLIVTVIVEIHTVALATIQAAWDKARREGKISEFCRSYLNQWKPKPKAGDETALGNWNGCRVDPPDEPPIPDAFGVALSLDRTMVSIGAALIDDDGRLVVGAQGRWAYGFDELVTELARLQSTYGLPVVMDVKGRVVI